MMIRFLVATALLAVAFGLQASTYAADLTEIEQQYAFDFCAKSERKPTVVLKIEWPDNGADVDLFLVGDDGTVDYFKNTDGVFHFLHDGLSWVHGDLPHNADLIASCDPNWISGDYVAKAHLFRRPDHGHKVTVEASVWIFDEESGFSELFNNTFILNKVGVGADLFSFGTDANGVGIVE